MSRKKEPAPAVAKSRRLIAAEHKYKVSCEELATATATATARRATADAISWETPLAESIATRKNEAEAEKALKSATLAVKRAKHSVFKAGGKV